MTKLIYTLIGDPHLSGLETQGDKNRAVKYFDICNQADSMYEKTKGKIYNKTLAIGDVGFSAAYDLIGKNLDPNNHKFFKGNHDDYLYPQMAHDIGDYGLFQDDDDPRFNFFFVRGAYSKDMEQRKKLGWEWYEQEQLSYAQFQAAYDSYKEHLPQIVISHEAPNSARKAIFGYNDMNNTSNWLENMFQEHQPKLWIFGHYHCSVIKVIGGTVFMCLNELDTFSLEI